jgi:hypothetical protein
MQNCKNSWRQSAIVFTDLCTVRRQVENEPKAWSDERWSLAKDGCTARLTARASTDFALFSLFVL